MNHPATSDDINVLAPPSSLKTRKCSNSSPNAHNNDRDQIRQHRPRLTSHKAIMRLKSFHSMDRDCKEREVQKRQTITTKTNADTKTLFDDRTCDLLFTPPGRSSYLPGSTPQSVGLDIDTTSDDSSSPSPRQVASTPPCLHRRHTTPFTARRTNVSHLYIDNVFERSSDSGQNPSTSSTSITAGPFRLQMKRTLTPIAGQ